jgi:hypothetical protein
VVVWENKLVSPSTIGISMINGHQDDTATDLDFDIGTFPLYGCDKKHDFLSVDE